MRWREESEVEGESDEVEREERVRWRRERFDGRGDEWRPKLNLILRNM